MRDLSHYIYKLIMQQLGQCQTKTKIDKTDKQNTVESPESNPDICVNLVEK